MVTLLTKTCSLTFTAYQGEIHKKLAAEFIMSYDLTAGLPLQKKNSRIKSWTSRTVATCLHPISTVLTSPTTIPTKQCQKGK